MATSWLTLKLLMNRNDEIMTQRQKNHFQFRKISFSVLMISLQRNRYSLVVLLLLTSKATFGPPKGHPGSPQLQAITKDHIPLIGERKSQLQPHNFENKERLSTQVVTAEMTISISVQTKRRDGHLAGCILLQKAVLTEAQRYFEKGFCVRGHFFQLFSRANLHMFQCSSTE